MSDATTSQDGWRNDPTGRHQLRYHDGTRWTEHVSDSGTQSDDQLGACHEEVKAILGSLLNMDGQDAKTQRERIKLALRTPATRETARQCLQVTADFQQRSARQTRARGTRTAIMGQRRKGVFGAINTAARVSQTASRTNLQGERAAFNQDFAALKARIDEATLTLKRARSDAPVVAWRGP